MKKLLLVAAVALGSFSVANAQVDPCTPNPGYTPSSPTGAGIEDLPCARPNELYKASSTIVVPTEVTFGGSTVKLCSVRVDSISNWPMYTTPPLFAIFKNGTQYAPGAWVPINTANPSDRACVSISATFTAPYQDTIRVRGTAKVGASCPGFLDVSFDALNAGGIPVGFTVDPSCTYYVGVEENLSNNSFDVAQNFPNPVTGESQIVFNVPAAGKVNFRITSLVGSVISDKTIGANAGKNIIDINAGSFAPGVYMYSVTYNGSTVTKRMIVK
ncbi:MAG: T9SS type A sorting domain-containing protein [Flavobacteriales bacterium]